jgi:hypothetical protein
MAVGQRDGSGTFLFLLAVLLFIIALVLAMFIAFKKGENLTKNDKLSIHRVYWTFLASFGFLFFAVLVSYATGNTSSLGSKKSCKYRYRSKHSNNDNSEHSSVDGDHDYDENHECDDSYHSDSSHHSYSMKDYSTVSSS